MKNAHTINAAVNRIADDIDEFADEYAAEHVRTHRADVAANPEHVADEIRHEIAAFAINRAFDEFPTDAAAFVAARADIAEHVRETAAHIRGEIRDAAAALNAAANDTPATDADETDEIEITTFAAVVLAAVTVFAAVGAFGGNAVVALFPAFGVVAILAGGFLAELSDIVAAGPGDTPGAFAARITDEYGDAVAGRHPDYRRALTARIAERIRAEFPETADTADGIASDAVAVAVPVTPHRFYRSDDTPDTPRREYPHRTAADRIADAYNRVTAVIGVNTPAGIVAAVAYTGGLLALTQFVAIPNAVISAAIFGATFAGRGGFDPFADGDPADAFADAFADADTDTIGDILADADLFDGNADALTEFAADRRQYGFAPPALLAALAAVAFAFVAFAYSPDAVAAPTPPPVFDAPTSPTPTPDPVTPPRQRRRYLIDEYAGQIIDALAADLPGDDETASRIVGDITDAVTAAFDAGHNRGYTVGYRTAERDAETAADGIPGPDTTPPGAPPRDNTPTTPPDAVTSTETPTPTYSPGDVARAAHPVSPPRTRAEFIGAVSAFAADLAHEFIDGEKHADYTRDEIREYAALTGADYIDPFAHIFEFVANLADYAAEFVAEYTGGNADARADIAAGYRADVFAFARRIDTPTPDADPDPTPDTAPDTPRTPNNRYVGSFADPRIFAAFADTVADAYADTYPVSFAAVVAAGPDPDAFAFADAVAEITGNIAAEFPLISHEFAAEFAAAALTDRITDTDGATYPDAVADTSPYLSTAAAVRDIRRRFPAIDGDRVTDDVGVAFANAYRDDRTDATGTPTLIPFTYRDIDADGNTRYTAALASADHRAVIETGYYNREIAALAALATHPLGIVFGDVIADVSADVILRDGTPDDTPDAVTPDPVTETAERIAADVLASDPDPDALTRAAVTVEYNRVIVEHVAAALAREYPNIDPEHADRTASDAVAAVFHTDAGRTPANDTPDNTPTDPAADAVGDTPDEFANGAPTALRNAINRAEFVGYLSTDTGNRIRALIDGAPDTPPDTPDAVAEYETAHRAAFDAFAPYYREFVAAYVTAYIVANGVTSPDTIINAIRADIYAATGTPNPDTDPDTDGNPDPDPDPNGGNTVLPTPDAVADTPRDTETTPNDGYNPAPDTSNTGTPETDTPNDTPETPETGAAHPPNGANGDETDGANYPANSVTNPYAPTDLTAAVEYNYEFGLINRDTADRIHSVINVGGDTDPALTPDATPDTRREYGGAFDELTDAVADIIGDERDASTAALAAAYRIEIADEIEDYIADAHPDTVNPADVADAIRERRALSTAAAYNRGDVFPGTYPTDPGADTITRRDVTDALTRFPGGH